jgi:hypothetical protein
MHRTERTPASMSDSVDPAVRTLEARRIRPPGLDFHRSRIATLRSQSPRPLPTGESGSVSVGAAPAAADAGQAGALSGSAQAGLTCATNR